MKELVIIGAPTVVQNMYVPSTVKFVKAARMCEQSQSLRHLTCYRASKSLPLVIGNSQNRYQCKYGFIRRNGTERNGTERVQIPILCR